MFAIFVIFSLIQVSCSTKQPDAYRIINSKFNKVKNYQADFKVFYSDKLVSEGIWIAMGDLYKIEGKTYENGKSETGIMLIKNHTSMYFYPKGNFILESELSEKPVKMIMENNNDFKFIGEKDFYGEKTYIFKALSNPNFKSPYFNIDKEALISYGEKDGVVREIASGEYRMIFTNVRVNNKDITNKTFVLPINNKTKIVKAEKIEK